MNKCFVKNCRGEHAARNLCGRHYSNATHLIRRGKETWESIEKQLKEKGSFSKRVYSKFGNERLDVDENLRRQCALKRMPANKYAHLLYDENINPGKDYKDYLKEKDIKLASLEW